MREDLLFTITHAGLCLNACVPAACECLLSVCTVHNCYECVYTCLLLECVCLFLMSLIIGHRPDSHQVLSWLVISSAPHCQISYLNVCVCLCLCVHGHSNQNSPSLSTCAHDNLKHYLYRLTLYHPHNLIPTLSITRTDTHTRRNGPWWLP